MSPASDQAGLAQAADRLILALDFRSGPTALLFLDQLERSSAAKRLRWVKVGLELYLASGATIVCELKERGYQVFLDLKLHDIPNTVAAAVRSLGSMEPEMLTVHACGGPAMLEAAASAAHALPRPPRLLAVTVLTSMNAGQLLATGVSDLPPGQALRLAELAWRAGIRGLISSPQDAAALTETLPGVHLVTPGIRSASDAHGDQQRVATAAQALESGASQLVVGRPITQAADPGAALDGLLAEIAGALQATPAKK